jgi:hypothetical protein
MLNSDKLNTAGYWENRDLLSVSKKVLTLCGGKWNKPAWLPKDWEKRKDFRDLVREAKTFVKGYFSGHELWGWKDPRAVFFMPFWERVLEGKELVFVICVRNPLDVAQSNKAGKGMTIEDGLRLWETYMKANLDVTEGRERYFTRYEDYFNGWRKSLFHIVRALGLEMPEQKDVGEFIKLGLRHSASSDQEFYYNKDISQECKHLYRRAAWRCLS